MTGRLVRAVGRRVRVVFRFGLVLAAEGLALPEWILSRPFFAYEAACHAQGRPPTPWVRSLLALPPYPFSFAVWACRDMAGVPT